MQRILMIEDEPNIRELLAYNLEQEGYIPLQAEDGLTGLEMIQTEAPDLILLDVMLPGKNGYDICKELRSVGNQTPIIMLTAKNDEIDKILGLEFGADDYLAKPFSTRELLARIKAVLRRTNGKAQKDRESGTMGNQADDQYIGGKEGAKALLIGKLRIDRDSHEVTFSGTPIFLTLKEFDLLEILAKNKGRVLTRDQLLDKVWGYEYVGETRTVDVHIRYLRKKIEDVDPNNRYIETIRGVGYKML